MPSSFSRKSKNRILKSPHVEWNPEKNSIFDCEANSYIPNKMFPCRKEKTSQLKLRNFGVPFRPYSA